MDTTIKKYISSDLDSVIRAKPDDELGATLNKITSTHQPVFVFDDEDFKGVVYITHALFKNKNAYTSSVSSSLVIPPQITPQTKLYELAEFMLMTRLYKLPVFDDKKNLIGTVSVDEIIKDTLHDKKLFKSVKDNISPHKPITMSMDVSVDDVYKTMIREKVSRVVITDDDGQLVGIASRSDIGRAFIAETPRQRFGRRMQGLFYSSYYDKESRKREEDPISAYYQVNVHTGSVSDSEKDILRKLIENERNSIVIVDKNNKPVGFVSRSDIIQALANLRPSPEFKIHIPDTKNIFSVSDFQRLYHSILTFAEKISKRMKVKNVTLTTDVVKNAQGDINEYSFTLKFVNAKGDVYVAHAQEWDVSKAIHDAISKLSQQIS